MDYINSLNYRAKTEELIGSTDAYEIITIAHGAFTVNSSQRTVRWPKKKTDNILLSRSLVEALWFLVVASQLPLIP